VVHGGLVVSRLGFRWCCGTQLRPSAPEVVQPRQLGGRAGSRP